MNPEEYKNIIGIIEDAILATDLAVYFKYVPFQEHLTFFKS